MTESPWSSIEGIRFVTESDWIVTERGKERDAEQLVSVEERSESL
jgi:hypothetical protein